MVKTALHSNYGIYDGFDTFIIKKFKRTLLAIFDTNIETLVTLLGRGKAQTTLVDITMEISTTFGETVATMGTSTTVQ